MADDRLPFKPTRVRPDPLPGYAYVEQQPNSVHERSARQRTNIELMNHAEVKHRRSPQRQAVHPVPVAVTRHLRFSS